MNSSNPNNFPTKYHLVWGGLLQYEHLEGTHSVHSRTHTCTHNTCQDKVCLRVTNPPSLPETIPPGSTSDFQADEHVPGGADNIIIGQPPSQLSLCYPMQSLLNSTQGHHLRMQIQLDTHVFYKRKMSTGRSDNELSLCFSFNSLSLSYMKRKHLQVIVEGTVLHRQASGR